MTQQVSDMLQLVVVRNITQLNRNDSTNGRMLQLVDTRIITQRNWNSSTESCELFVLG